MTMGFLEIFSLILISFSRFIPIINTASNDITRMKQSGISKPRDDNSNELTLKLVNIFLIIMIASLTVFELKINYPIITKNVVFSICII